MLLKRYSSIDYILRLDFEEALGLIDYAFEKQFDELLYQRWIARYQEFISFDEFKNSLKPIKVKTAEEIMKEQAEIISLFNERGLIRGSI